jgi:hypothetical protein
MKFKIEKIYYNTANKDKKPYIDKNGKPFAIANIYVDKNLIDDPDFEGKISYFDADGDAVNWQEGMELEGMIEKNDKGFFNFKKPSRLSLLEERVEKLEKYCFGDTEDKKDEPKKNEETDADGLPF